MKDLNLKILITATAKGLNNIKAAGAKLGGLKKQVLALTAPLATIAAVGAKTALEVQNAGAKMAAGLGIARDAADQLADVAQNIYGKNLGQSVTDASAVITQAFREMGDVGEAELENIAGKALMIRDAFGTDTQESIVAAKNLMENFGMTSDEAFDFIAKGYQKGLDGSGDFLESINEYATQFKNGGADAAQFFSILESGYQGGMLGTDKAADAFKEFRVRIQDGTAATADALDQLGINQLDLNAKLASGATSAADAFQLVVKKLNETGDKSVQIQAGVGLLGTQFEDLGTQAALALSMTSTKMSDLTGATQKLEEQYLTLSNTGQLIWRKIVIGATEAVKALEWLINTVRQTDTVTKTLVISATAVGAALIAWNLGGKTAVGALLNVTTAMWNNIKALGAGLKALNAFMLKFALAKAALIGGLLITIAWAGVKVWEAVKAFNSMRDAQKQAEISQQNLISTSQKLIEKTKAFKDIKIPDNLTGKSAYELRVLQSEIIKSRAYWYAYKNTLDESADSAKIKEADAKLKTLNQTLGAVAAAAKNIGLKKPAEGARLSAEAIKKFEKAARKAYKTAQDEAAKYGKEVIEWEDKMKTARMSTEDKLRELGRKGLDEEAQWNDKKLQAEEKLAAAKKALKEQDYALAEKLAQDAEGLYANLATEVKGSDGAVKQSMEQTKQIAMNGVKQTGDLMQKVLGQQKDAAAKMEKEYSNKAGKIKESLDKIATDRDAKVMPKIDDASLATAEKIINKLTKDETKKIKIVTEKTEKHAAGGTAGNSFPRRTGKLPGYGRQDVVPTMLTWGERITNALSTRVWDSTFPGFMDAVNRITSPHAAQSLLASISTRIKKFRDGGIVSIPKIPKNNLIPGYATGGIAGTPKQLGVLDLKFQNRQKGQIIGRTDVLKMLEADVARARMAAEI